MSAQSSSQSLIQVSVEEFARYRAETSETLQLLDVREPQEVEIAYIEGFQVFPLSEFAEWSDRIQTQLDPHQATIVLCHHGVRSAQMCQWLMQQGFTNVKNLAGGIDAYSITVDNSIPRY
ncbi:MAG: rhodanese-related sulfurtransferase [Scytolyngbya sp. HA4215-MV1]|jgi:rhodanese-related sulfurtransferase|nr:rhodanese-related sulfurtransferase [Scytolyngbya sp. HA4215-MV1]